MKNYCHLLIFAFLILSLFSCQKEKTGTLEFYGVNAISEIKSAGTMCQDAPDDFLWVTDNLEWTILDISVSQQVVDTGNPDDLEWFKIGENTEMKFWNEYTFTANNLPVGEYKSFKINFKNLNYRHAHLYADPSVTMTMLESMDSWGKPCDPDRAVPTNYFSVGGNYSLNDDSLFYLVTDSEKMGGFTINAEGTTKFYMKMNGAGGDGIEPCRFKWKDYGNIGTWDCDIDSLDFWCPPEVTTMFDFIVKYE